MSAIRTLSEDSLAQESRPEVVEKDYDGLLAGLVLLVLAGAACLNDTARGWLGAFLRP